MSESMVLPLPSPKKSAPLDFAGGNVLKKSDGRRMGCISGAQQGVLLQLGIRAA